MRSVLAKLFPVVRFFSWTFTVVPLTVTDAAIRSPAETFSGALTDAAGTSVQPKVGPMGSYQAL